MLKKILKLNIIIICLLLLLPTSCKKDSDDGPTDPGGGETQTATEQISSTEFGRLETASGAGITAIAGTVPQNSNGDNGQVTFSVETNADEPAAMQSGMTRQTGVTKFGPDGFQFRWPVRVALPYSGDTDPGDYTVSFYDALSESWKVVAGSDIDVNEKVIYADVIALGFYSLSTLSQGGLGKVNVETASGGFEYGGTSGYYYTLTVASYSNLKYPWQLSYYGGSLTGYTGSSGSSPTGSPLSPTHIRLPQADYQIWISRTTPGTISTWPVIETYSLPASGSINGPVSYGAGNSSGSGWTTLSLPGGGDWREGRPDGWPVPTVSYGTGEFQATLTWANISGGRRSDVDLHLYGPNDLHVYYSSKTSPDESLQLDVDAREFHYGTVTENIYSLSSFPSGEYVVRVNLYCCDATNFNLRIINGSTVRTFQQYISTVNSADDVANMLEVYRFTH